MLRSRFVLSAWAALLACGLLALGTDRADAEEVLASWYGPGYGGLPTASGEPYDASRYTASHETLPLGTPLEVSYGGKTVLVTVNDRGDFPGGRELDLSEAAARELGLAGTGVDYVEVGYPGGGARNDAAPVGGYPSSAGNSSGTGVDGQAQRPTGVAGASPEASQTGGLVGHAPVSPDYTEGSRNVDAPGTAPGETGRAVPNPQGGVPQGGLPQGGLSQSDLPQDGATRGAGSDAITPEGAYNPDFVAQPNEIGTGAPSPVMQPFALETGVDPGFVGRQEGFRLDGYVPDSLFSMSGTTVGTGVDIGQRSAADIQALDIPQTLKDKLIPYAGLKGQGAVNFLANRPLYLTEEEAYALDQAVSQDIFGDVASLYDADTTGDSFLELPLDARTAIGDLAYQYGPNLEQRLPDFWGDVTQGRWDEATQTLRDFGDRYPDRRNEEANLLQQAIDRGDLAAYLVQSGDTLSGVAARRGLSPEYLAALNGLPDPNVIYGGQALYY